MTTIIQGRNGVIYEIRCSDEERIRRMAKLIVGFWPDYLKLLARREADGPAARPAASQGGAEGLLNTGTPRFGAGARAPASPSVPPSGAVLGEPVLGLALSPALSRVEGVAEGAAEAGGR